jgi:Rap1a immunity proteins
MKMNKHHAVGFALATAGIAFSANGYAGPGWVGNDLKPKCDETIHALSDQSAWNTGSALSSGQCAGYIAGVIEGTRITSILDKAGKYPYCIPVTSTQLQDISVVEKYMNDHPEQWDMPAGLLITEAFKAAYPCPKGK